MDELPAGLHKIILGMKDSSGNMGDKSGFTSGQLRLFINTNADNEQTVLGINLLSTIEESKISDVLKNNNEKLNDEEKQLKEILRQLNIIPATKDNAELMEEDIDRAKKFVRKMQKGSAAVKMIN